MNKKEVKQARRAREKADSKLGFRLLVGWLTVILCCMVFISCQAKADEIELTYYAKSEHFSSIPYNQNHDFIGVTFRDEVSGYSVAYFKNSYFEKSVLLAYSRYWQPLDNIELNLTGGLVTGYDGFDQCRGNKKSGYFCPAFEAGIKYTKYKYIQPKLSLFGDALVLSFSARF